MPPRKSAAAEPVVDEAPGVDVEPAEDATTTPTDPPGAPAGWRGPVAAVLPEPVPEVAVVNVEPPGPVTVYLPTDDPITLTVPGVSRVTFTPEDGTIVLTEGSRDLATILASVPGASLTKPQE